MGLFDWWEVRAICGNKSCLWQVLANWTNLFCRRESATFLRVHGANPQGESHSSHKKTPFGGVLLSYWWEVRDSNP